MSGLIPDDRSSPASGARLERLWSTQQLAERWALSPEALGLAVGHTDQARLGLACQLAFWRTYARFPEQASSYDNEIENADSARLVSSALPWSDRTRQVRSSAAGVHL